MSTQPTNEPSSDDRIDVAIAAWLEAAEQGAPPDPEEFIARYPDLATELRSFFADQAQFQQLAGKLGTGGVGRPRSVPDSSASAAAAPNSATPGDRPDPDQATLAWKDRDRQTAGRVVQYFGDYELLEEIARGGMGVVFKARQTSLNRLVAVKMILSGQLASAEDVQRFRTEAEAAAQLDHPGIVPIYEVGQCAGQHYFSMGFVEGQSLAARVLAGPLPAREAAELVKSVAEAVQYAHDKGVIHRDLKPGNVLLDRQGRPRVTDFGLAKLTESGSGLTGTGQILGTPSYMPPEQAAAQVSAVGRASDIYSLGAILYCLLTGRPPFQAASAIETLLQVQKQEPVAPRQLNPNIPIDLDTIVLKCLDKSPSRRYRTAAELAEELGRYLEGRPIMARRVSRSERFWRWCQREPLVSGLCAAVLVALVAGTAVSSYFAVMEGKRAEAAEARQDEREQRTEAQRQTGIALQAVAEEKRQKTIAETARTEEEKQRAEAVRSANLAEERRRDADESARRARRNLYTAHMTLVQNAWESNRVGAVRDLLKRNNPNPGEEDFRGFEWFYWDALSHRERMTIVPARGGNCVVYSPKGTRIATAGPDGSISLWDPATGTEMLRLNGHPGFVVTCLDFSPDGRQIASGSWDKTAKIWDVGSGRQTLSFVAHDDWVHRVAFSPTGKQLATTCRTGLSAGVKLWNAENGAPILTLLPESEDRQLSCECLTFSPDGTRVAVASRNLLKLWSIATSEYVLTIKGHLDDVVCAAFSHDGAQVATASKDQTARIWDAKTGRQLAVLSGHVASVTCVAFSPDGRRVATASADQTVRLWNPENGTKLGTFKGHQGEVFSVVFSPDGKQLASSGDDTIARIWDVALGEEPRTLQAAQFNSMRGLAISPDGTRIAFQDSRGSQRIVRVVAFETESEPLVLQAQQVSAIAFSPDGKQILTGGADQAVKVWDAATGEELFTLPGHSSSVDALAVSPDGRIIASGCKDRTITLWDSVTRSESHKLQGHARGVTSLAFDALGRQLVSSSEDRTLKLWDTASGKEIRTLSNRSERFTPGRENASVAISPDGLIIASIGEKGAIRLWNAVTGEPSQTLNGHTDAVTSLAFTSDGTRLISGSEDQTVKVWNVLSGQETLTLKGQPRGIKSIAISRDGTSIAAAGDRGALSWWSAPRQRTPSVVAMVGGGSRGNIPREFPFASATSGPLAMCVVEIVSDSAGILHELTITEEQKSAIHELANGVRWNADMFRQMEWLAPPDRLNFMEKFGIDTSGKRKEADTRLRSVLNADQYARADQILRQRMGLLALSRDGEADRLQLNDDQRAKFKAVLDEFEEQRRAVPFPQSMATAASRKEAVELRLRELLTPQQLKSWDESLGAPFTPPPVPTARSSIAEVPAANTRERPVRTTQSRVRIPQKPADTKVPAVVRSTLTTAGTQIRQFAFDGNDETFFESRQNPGSDDYFVLSFDDSVKLVSLTVETGGATGVNRLESGRLEVSSDGKAFHELTRFVNGVARAESPAGRVKALRIVPGAQILHPLVVREISLQSKPEVALFHRFPVEIAIDTSNARDLTEWAERAAIQFERAYSVICDELKDDRFTPPRKVDVELREIPLNLAGDPLGQIAERFILSAGYVRRRAGNQGVIVDVAIRAIQQYRPGERNQQWLQPAIAEFVRCRLDPSRRERSRASVATTLPVSTTVSAVAARYWQNPSPASELLEYVVGKYDRDLVRKLNSLLREKKYTEEVFRDWTGKSLEELDREWIESKLEHATPEERAKTFAARGEHARAIDEYSKIINESPRNLQRRAHSYQMNKEYGKALEDYNQALKINSKDSLVYFEAARLLATCPDERFRDAARAVELAVRGFEGSRKEWFELEQLAHIYALTGNFEKAVEWQTKAVELASSTGQGYSRQKLTAYREGKTYVTAPPDFTPDFPARERARVSAPVADRSSRSASVEALIRSAGNRFSNLEYDAAISDLTEAIEIDSKNGALHRYRASAHAKRGDAAAAIADYKNAIQLDAKDLAAHNLLAWLLATWPEDEFRNGKQAIDLAQRACELSLWKDANHLETLASAYAETGDFEQAIHWQSKAVELCVDLKKPAFQARLELFRSGKPTRQELIVKPEVKKESHE